MRKLSTVLLAGTAMAGLTTAASTTSAQAGVCPATGTTTTTCNLFFNFNSNGSITTTAGVGTSYDFAGSEDSLIGVINNSGKTIFSISFGVQPTDIFGFDGDGIGTYAGGTNTLDKSSGHYGGSDAWFTSLGGTGLPPADGPGTVHFINGIASGSTGFFSLEEPVSISKPPVLIPEPSTWAMMLLGFAGLGFAGYRGARKAAALT